MTFREIHPAAWLPSLHFAKGVAYVMVMVISLLMFRQSGIDNLQIALCVSTFYLPWVTKFLWRRWVDNTMNYSYWVLLTELLLSATFIALAFWPTPVWTAVLELTVVAWLTAVHNVAADALSRQREASPHRSVTIELSRKFAVVVGQGVLVMLAGNLQLLYRGHPYYSWCVMFYIVAGIYLVLFFWHIFTLPQSSRSGGNFSRSQGSVCYQGSFHLGWRAVVFLFFYPFFVGMQSKIGILFLIDVPSNEGLGLSPQEFALVMGTVGIISLTAGTLQGRRFIVHNGFRRSLPLMSACMLVPCICYAGLAYWEPDNLTIVSLVVAVEQLSYGFGFAAYLFFLHQIADRELGKSIMALSLMLSLVLGGLLQTVLGYYYFFLVAVVASLMMFWATWINRNFKKEGVSK